MIYDMIKTLIEEAGYSQAQLAKIFHVSTDYLLGLESQRHIVLEGYSKNEIELIYGLIKYFDENKLS